MFSALILYTVSVYFTEVIFCRNGDFRRIFKLQIPLLLTGKSIIQSVI
jgi:hypothetical protein